MSRWEGAGGERGDPDAQEQGLQHGAGTAGSEPALQPSSAWPGARRAARSCRAGASTAAGAALSDARLGQDVTRLLNPKSRALFVPTPTSKHPESEQKAPKERGGEGARHASQHQPASHQHHPMGTQRDPLGLTPHHQSASRAGAAGGCKPYQLCNTTGPSGLSPSPAAQRHALQPCSPAAPKPRRCGNPCKVSVPSS